MGTLRTGLGRLQAAVTQSAEAFVKALAGRPSGTRGEAMFAGWGGSGISTPGSWTGEKLAQVRAYQGWVAVCVDFRANRVGRVPTAVRVAPAGERAKYQSRVKAYHAGKADALPSHRKWVSHVRRKAMAGPLGDHEDVEKLDDGDPLVRLLSDPNGPENGTEFWPHFVMFRDLCGESYLWKVRDDGGRVVELWVLPAPWVTPYSGNDRLVDYYEVRPWGGSGRVARLKPEDVVCWRKKSPLHPLASYGPTQSAGTTIDTYGMLEAARYAALQNCSDAGGVITLPDGADDIDPDTLNRFMARFRANVQGLGNVGKPLVLMKGMEYKSRDSALELAYQSSLDQSRDYVMAFYELDKTLMGFSDAASYAAPAVAWKKLKTSVIGPLQVNLAGVLTERLAAEFGDEYAVVFEDDGGFDDPQEKRANWQAAMSCPAGPAVTQNEIRQELLGLEPVDDPEADALHYNPSLVGSDQYDAAVDAGLGAPAAGYPGGGDKPAGDPPAMPGESVLGKSAAADEKSHPLDLLGDEILAALGLPQTKTHGPPPFPGAVFDEGRHRWVKPDGDVGDETGDGHPAVVKAKATLTQRAGAVASALRQRLAGLDPADVLDTAEDWGRLWSAKHADPVAAHLGVSTHTAALVLSHLAAHAVVAVKKHFGGAGGAKAAAPHHGPPPFPGAVFDPSRHRWVKPQPDASGPKKPAGKPAAVPQKKPSEKAERAKAAHVLVDAGVQRYAEEHNEPRFAKAMGGVSFPNSEAVDVAIPGKSGTVAHGVELKTMTAGKDDKITMNAYAQVRKKLWEQGQGATFHTVVSDDRAVKDANGAGKHDDSKRVYYYRRGIAGSARIGSMHRVESEAELKRLMSLPEDKLPPAARRTEKDWLTAGTWKPLPKGERGYRNTKTGQEVRPKK